MITYAGLLAQKHNFDEQINKTRKAEAAAAIETVKQSIKEFTDYDHPQRA